MSTITFHTRDSHADLNGSERFWFSHLVTAVAQGFVERGLTAEGRQWVDRFVVPKYRDDASNLHREAFRDLLANPMLRSDAMLAYRGFSIAHGHLCDNLSMVVGGNPLRLATRLHGQCEMYAFVEGRDRGWLADLIDEGLSSGVFRSGWYQSQADAGVVQWLDQGWGGVVALLRQSDADPVVTSYSVSGSFPHSVVQAQGDDGSPDQIDVSVRWDSAMSWLRDREKTWVPGRGVQLQPHGFDTYRFGHCLSWLDMFAPDVEHRLDQWLGGSLTRRQAYGP